MLGRGAPGRASAENVRRSRLARRPGSESRSKAARVGVWADHTGYQNATEGLGASDRDGSELYCETRHHCTEKCAMGPRRLGGAARPIGGPQPDRTLFFRLTPPFGLRSQATEERIRSALSHPIRLGTNLTRKPA